ncbi:HIT family protein [Sphingomonas sp. BN140010]|uniref:HIT family protein n=1 Tax=Sphingomonas arvum TaxID=2992113 RepID=A0ABT3JD39_9SPHN|nr:HIT family protein [Sphingomonas sp. BN140010]MCW3796995.1 HIT family protein [Sphingomonas sp. BN140010]
MAHETLLKFGYPGTLLREGRHWALLLRPAQPTIGSLVLCATSDARAYGELPAEAFTEQGEFVTLAERLLSDFVGYERINYLMLMMVDPHVHFHVIPRYEGLRSFAGEDFPDAGWPGPPALAESRPAPAGLGDELRRRIAQLPS